MYLEEQRSDVTYHRHVKVAIDEIADSVCFATDSFEAELLDKLSDDSLSKQIRTIMDKKLTEVSVLSDKLEEKKDSPIHILLYSYLNSPESFVDLDFELMGFEFECNSWRKINKKISYQIKKEDFLSCIKKGNLVFIQNLMIICEGL